MVQIIEAHQPRQNYAKMIGDQLSEGLKSYLGQQKLGRENEALKNRGIDVAGVNDPETRAQIIAHDLKYGAKKRAIEATQEKGFDAQSSPGRGRLEPRTKKEPLPGFMGQDGIEPKRGLYTQKTTQGQLQPVRSAEQVQQAGIEFARSANEAAGQTIMSDQDGIEYENAKNNLALQSNQRIQGEQQALQQEKSAMNQKGREQAISTIGPENLTPEVASYFGKKAEDLAYEVNTESDLDKRLAEDITNYKKAVFRATNSVNEPPENKMGDDSLGEKTISDLRNKLEPILKMGLYDKARDILSEKGYGPEQRETVISNLSESTNKILSGIPNFPSHGKLDHKRGMPVVSRDYSPDQKEVLNNAMTQIFKSDPSTNIILLRKKMRDEKNVDWRGFKDALDYAVDTGALTLNDKNLDQYYKMSEPEETGLQQLLRFFGVGGR